MIHEIKAIIGLLYFGILLATPVMGQQRVFLAGHERELQDDIDKLITGMEVDFIQIIYEESIDPEHDGVLNADLLKQKVEMLFPDQNQKGFGCLDWETPVLDILYFQKEGSDRVVEEMLKALQLVQTMRPNMKWGYYGLNRQEYYKRDFDWAQRSRNFLPLIEACDVNYPSIYLFYPEAVNGRDFELSYARENTSLNLNFCFEKKIPVVPFVWHRWHDGDKKYGMQSISPTEFRRHVSAILDERFKGDGVSGIALWCMDKYFVTQNDVVKKEMGQLSPELYRRKIISEYLTIMQQEQNH